MHTLISEHTGPLQEAFFFKNLKEAVLVKEIITRIKVKNRALKYLQKNINYFTFQGKGWINLQTDCLAHF